ncbi:hypothetical protein [Mycolicibacterium llatzerense]|uniref:hypothetical protein n=1 Tax=Mycolicibacterium llatzerense TaxID=280871 RepID=UPI0021B62C5D|nr:hypothetical protein [Mycolicibacterium llatzerense]
MSAHTTARRDQQADRMATYAHSAAQGMLRSLEYYQNSSPAVGDGTVSTPAYYANMLRKVLHYRGDALPGDAAQWWGDRWRLYAQQIIATVH